MKNNLKNGGLIKVAVNKAVSAQKIKDASSYGVSIEPKIDFDLLIDVYENNTYAKACIDFKALNVVKGGFNIVSDNGENDDETNKRINDVYNMFMNVSDRNFNSVLNDAVVDLITTGNCALEVSRGIDGKPKRIYHIPINTIRYAKPKSGDDWKVGYKFVMNPNSSSDRIYFNKYTPLEEERREEEGYYLNDSGKTNEVIWIKLSNPRDRKYGLSPSITLTKNYLLNKYIDEFNTNEFESGMLSKFLLVVKNGALTGDSVEALTEAMNEVVESKKWNTIPILSVRGQGADVDVKDVGAGTKEGSFIGLKKDAIQDVLVAFGVPAAMVGIVDDVNRANGSEMEKLFYEKQIVPLQEMFEFVFTQMIKYDFGYEDLNFKFIAPNFDDKKLISEITNAGIQTGKYSINEARQMEGLDMISDDGANERFVYHSSMGLINVKDLANLDSERLESEQGKAKGEAIVDKLLSIKDQYERRVKKREVLDGTDGGEDKYLGNE